MKTLFGLAVVLFLAGMSGCASNGSPKAEALPASAGDAVSPKGSGWSRWETCPLDGHASGASSCVRKVAADRWLYAQLASNAYADDRNFKLPTYVEPQPLVQGWGGFKAQVFRVSTPGQAPHVVIAYAGTEGIGDWLIGNLNPLYSQGRQGRQLLIDVRKEFPGHSIVLTGHSLGGGIAKYVVTREPGLRAYVFNPSVFVFSGRFGSEENIYAVSHYGEVLALFRKLVVTGMDGHVTLGCKKAKPIGRHSVRLIAECLTHVAAWDDKRAACSLELNGLSPPKRFENNELVEAAPQQLNSGCPTNADTALRS